VEYTELQNYSPFSSFAADACLLLAELFSSAFAKKKKECVIFCVLRYWYSDWAADRTIRGSNSDGAGKFFHNVLVDSDAHQASFSVGTGIVSPGV
jgi:hypothetical protein